MSKNSKQISLIQAIIPITSLVVILFFNVFFIYGDDALSGSNQFVLLIGSAIAALIGFINKVPYEKMILEISENLKSSTNALLILLMVGALSGTWLVSGVIPTMVFYGLKILDPSYFLIASLIICAIISFLLINGCSKESPNEELSKGVDFPDQESWGVTIILTDSSIERARVKSGHLEKYNQKQHIFLDENVEVDFFASYQKNLLLHFHLIKYAASDYIFLNDQI